MMGAILPLIVLLFFTAIAVAPWAGPGDPALGVAAALLPAMAIHYWGLRRASVLPEVAILFSGLCVDIVGGGVLGFWTFVYSLAWLSGLVQRHWAALVWKPGRWLLFAVSLAGLTLAIYLMGKILMRPVASGRELAEAALWLVLVYPLLGAIMRIADGERSSRPLEVA